MNKSYVLDASALLAVIFQEAGSEKLEGSLDGAVMSSVNLSEVVAKLLEKGFSQETMHEFLTGFGLRSNDFEIQDAFAAGKLRPLTKDFGLSLGDRACIALAQRLDLPVVTSDQAFEGAAELVKVELIR